MRELSLQRRNLKNWIIKPSRKNFNLAAILIMTVGMILSSLIYWPSITKVDKTASSTPYLYQLNEIRKKQAANEVPKIPHILYFVETRWNILELKEPKLFYDNILKTIRIYKEAWKDDGDEEPDVRFLVSEDCERIIQEAEPRLLRYYRAWRTWGKDRSNMCRAAAIYLTGGYYFDNDMETVQAWDPQAVDPSCTFSIGHIHGSRTFQNSILAATPRHPLMLRMLEGMLDYYEGRLYLEWYKRGWWGWRWKTWNLIMGSRMGAYAYEQLDYGTIEDRDSCLLEERRLSPDIYKDFPRQHGSGPSCNYVFHNLKLKQVYFYTRVVGSEICGYPESDDA